MCDPVTIALVATAVTGGSAIMSGMQQRDVANYQAKQAEADAIAQQGAAAVRADRIRQLTRSRMASATAATAASGLTVDTANPINTEISKRGELDALTGINDSIDQSSRLRAQAQGLRTGGDNAMTAGLITAAGSAVSNYGLYKGGWYGTKTPSTTPAVTQ